MNSIIHGNCNTELEKIPSDSVNLVIMDPPYNIGFKYNAYVDKLPVNIYIEWQLKTIQQCARVLKDTGSLFFLHYPEMISIFYNKLRYGYKKKVSPLKVIDIIVWCYNAHTAGKPLRKSYRQWLWLSKGEPYNSFYGEYKNPNDKRIQKKMESGDLPVEVDWWFFNQVKNVSNEKTEHPCQLPVNMLKKIVLGTTKEGNIVLDPMCGSGTSCVAAKETNRQYIGIEMDEKYVSIANKRLEHKMAFNGLF